MSTTFAACLLGMYGLLIGSFTNVVIARVPDGRSIITPGSACPKCGHAIRPFDNIPVLSWLILRGRCRDCAAPISARYPAVEALVGVGFALIPVVLPGNVWLWPAAAWVVFLAVSLSLIDIAHHRLPNALTYPATPVLLALLAIPAAANELWGHWLTALLGGLAAFAFFGLIFVLYPKGTGLGDVKLSPTIGVALGWAGWAMFGVGMFAAFLIAGVASSAALVIQRRRGADTAGFGVPFGPFLFAGLATAALVGPPVYEWYLRVSFGT